MAMRASTIEKREALKLDIQQVVRTIIQEQGYHAVNVRKVAQQSGCAIGMVYTVYKDFDDLMMHVNATTLKTLLATLKQVAGRGSEPLSTTRQLGHAYLEFAKRYPHLWGAVFEHLYASQAKRPPWYQQIIDELFLTVERVIAPLYHHNERKTQRASRVLWAGLHGMTVLDQLDKLDAAGSDSARILADSLIEHYIAGLKVA